MSNLPYRQIHLDFHTPALSFELAKNFNKKDFQTILLDAAVNSITLTGRCHHGHIYYDTKLPAKHPQMKRDFLMEEVDACHEVGIRAPIYLTVGWDAFSADHHPEWLERKKDGSLYGFEDFGQLSPGWKTLCFNTGYLDYLKLQIIDTVNHFGSKLDGLFFDIVWQDPCYCNECNKKMIEKGYDLFNESDRIQFAKETEHFLKDEIYQTVYQQDKTCPIFFNEGNILPSIRENLNEYSHLEIESLPSGDWGYQHFPTVVRYAKNLGKEYVGMTGKFHKSWADFGSYKSEEALQYENFLTLAHGAKCSIGDQMYPDGTLQQATYELIGSVYKEVEKLESFNDNVEAITEIGIIHPGIVYESEDKVDLSLAGAVNILNESDFQFDIIDEVMDWTRYSLLILPDKITLTLTLEKKLSEYLINGGKVIASFLSGLNQEYKYPSEFGLNYLSENCFNPTYVGFDSKIDYNLPKGELVLHGRSLNVEIVNAINLAKEIKPLYQRNVKHYYSHYQAPLSEESGYPIITESENVIYFSVEIFEMYKYHGAKEYKQMVLNAIEILLGNRRIIRTNLPTTADVIVNHQKEFKKIIINLLHYIPVRTALSLDTIQDIIPLNDVHIEIDLNLINELLIDELGEITSVKSVREYQKISMSESNKKLSLEIPTVKGFEIIELTYQ